MNRSRFAASILSLAALLALAPAVGATEPATLATTTPGVRLRRFALMIGVNDGGNGRARLRYATSDAHSMAKVLENLGGVAPSDLVFVETPTRVATMDAFARVETIMNAGRTPGVRRELLVYYSGHSDEEGLLLGNDRITYDELRARIKQLPADLRVAILDSCASGAFTRGKGGVRRPPFLVDASADMRGHAFLTSSAANEVAQESDRISASFFTHFLVSGLRGAADVNQDHRVTLQEAYQFASAETLARTERTKGGPQHAAYEFDLSGTGDMVVTDVRTTQASLVLTPDLSGRIVVREASGAGSLVAELRKPLGNTIELGVEAGSYIIALEPQTSGGRPNTIFEAKATLASGERAELARLAFHPGKPLEVAVARGDASLGNDTVIFAAPEAPHTSTPVKLGIVPRDVDKTTDVHGFSFGFVGDRAARLDGFQLGLGWTQTDERMHGLQLAIGATVAEGDTKGMQLASGVTYAEGTFSGLQLAGIATFTRGRARGFQLGGMADLAEGSFSGVQLAGGVTAGRDVRGFQLAGGAAVADDMHGFQLAGGVNFARRMRGVQLGTVNVAGDNAGFQLGVINVARQTRGFRFGVVNVAEHDDGESFGLINVIGNGIHAVTVTSTDVMLTNLSFKLGGRHLYTAFGAGYTPGNPIAAGAADNKLTRDNGRWGPTLALGWRFRLPTGRLEHLDLEAASVEIFEKNGVSGEAPQVSSLRVQAGIRLAPHIALVAGAGVNVAVGQKNGDADLSLGGPQSVQHDGQTTVRIYPGFVAGLEI